VNKKKIFRIPVVLAAEFEKACTLMGVKEQEAAKQALEDWLRKNKGQASLEAYLKQGTAKPVIFQNITLQKIQVTVVKAELERHLRLFQGGQPYMKVEALKDIQKIYPTALHLFEETHDPDLQKLIEQVELLAKAEPI